MTTTTTTCDVCGTPKGETNHWLVVVVSRAEFWLTAPEHLEKQGTYTAKDICGEECAHKALSQWMDERRKTQ